MVWHKSPYSWRYNTREYKMNTLKGKVCTRFWWGNLRERDHWGDQDVDGRIILKWILRKW